MDGTQDAQTLKRRYKRLAARLANLGSIAQGTITERTITKEDPLPESYRQQP